MILIAHNIRSLHNVGSLFRSADAFGIERMYLTGFTGTPPRKEIAKTALGSEDRVSWEFQERVGDVVEQLKAQGYQILALETGPNAVSIREIPPVPEAKIALIVGNEVAGIEPEVAGAADAIVEIPMPGRKRSLNVSVAAGIALYALGRK